jgi:protein involved in polysaccharide export with SLBB domain
MTLSWITNCIRSIALASVAAMLVSSTGCITFTKHAVPASRLPHQYQAPSKCNLHPINFQLLGKPQAFEHLLDAGDVIGITVVGVIPPSTGSLPPLVSAQTSLARDYYPPLGSVNSPVTGIPYQVQTDGSIDLPGISTVNVRGKSLRDVAEIIAKEYVKAEVLKETSAQVNVTLIKSRVNRIVVLREDASSEAATQTVRGQAILHKRGSSMLVDLPVGESDVLHALAASGGLPGVDAYNEIWVLRRSAISDADHHNFENSIQAGGDAESAVRHLATHVEATRIPLKMCSAEAIDITPEQISLNAGDIVYIEPRKDEYYYTGGLLPGGQLPLPRDEDLDIIEAIAQATGSVGGLGGTSSVAVLRAGAGIGQIIPPTRVLILRKLPNGQQLPIRVDLNVAMRDPKERIKIMAGDYIMMYYKPGENFTNAALNFFNLNIGTSL